MATFKLITNITATDHKTDFLSVFDSLGFLIFDDKSTTVNSMMYTNYRGKLLEDAPTIFNTYLFELDIIHQGAVSICYSVPNRLLNRSNAV